MGEMMWFHMLDPAHVAPHWSRNLTAGQVIIVLIATTLGAAATNAATTCHIAKFPDLQGAPQPLH